MSESTTRAARVAARDAQFEYEARRLADDTDAVDHHVSFDFQRVVLAYDTDDVGGPEVDVGGPALGSEHLEMIHEQGYVIDKIFTGPRPGFDADIVVHVRRE